MGGVPRRCSRGRGLGWAGGGQRLSKDTPPAGVDLQPDPTGTLEHKVHLPQATFVEGPVYSTEAKGASHNPGFSYCLGAAQGSGAPGGGHLPGEPSPVWLGQSPGARGSCELLAAIVAEGRWPSLGKAFWAGCPQHPLYRDPAPSGRLTPAEESTT